MVQHRPASYIEVRLYLGASAPPVFPSLFYLKKHSQYHTLHNCFTLSYLPMLLYILYMPESSPGMRLCHSHCYCLKSNDWRYGDGGSLKYETYRSRHLKDSDAASLHGSAYSETTVRFWGFLSNTFSMRRCAHKLTLNVSL